jgi:NAD(P) transhydrogenase
VGTDERGRIRVDGEFRTDCPSVYAVGDVIGFPSLASTATEQGRLAALHAFGAAPAQLPKRLPLGIYTIPEVAMVGPTETQLTGEGVPCEVGVRGSASCHASRSAAGGAAS